MITATVDKNSIKIDREELMTSGSVKTNFVQFIFSEDWNGLTKTAIFQTKKVSIPVIVDGDDRVAIPWEAMAFPKEEIRFGVYGVRFDDQSTEDVDEEIVLPTIWGSLGKVVEGVLVESPPITEPTKDAYLQLLDYIKNLQPGGGGGGVDERVSDGTIFVGTMDGEPTVGFDYPVSYQNFIGLKPSNGATYLGLLTVGNDFYISSVTIATIDDELNDIQVRFDSLTKLTWDEEGIGGIPYVDQLVAPHDTYSAHDVETMIGKSLYYLTWSGDPIKTTGPLEVGKEFTAYFLYDGEQLNPTLNYYGVFVCDEYDSTSTERIKATLKNATLIGNRTESLNSFLMFFKLDAMPDLNVTTSIPFKSAVGVLPQWMNTPHRGLMTVGNELYLIDFRLEWLDHDNEAFQIKFTAIHPISNAGSKGDNGITFVPSVSSEGVISWINDGGLSNPDPVDIKGPTGDDALVYSEVLTWSNVSGDPAPVDVYSFADDGSRFNRIPKLNETWTGVMVYYSDADNTKTKDVFVATFKISGVSDGMYNSLLINKKSVMPPLTTDESAEDSFVTFKDQTITTPSELQTAIGHRPYYGCIHAINTRILGIAFTNDIVWISYRLISGTYYLDLVTVDGHCEAWSSAGFSDTFSSISSTKFLLEDELDLAEGTTFVGYFVSPPEVSSTVSMHPDWFIGKKPTVGEQYRGKARNNVNKWWDMVINVVGTFDNEGTTMYTVEVVSVTEIGELPAGGTTDQILAKKTDSDYDFKWIDAPKTDMLVVKDMYPITNVSTFTDIGLTISNYIDVLLVNSGILNRRQDNTLVTLSLSGDRTTLWMYTNNNQCLVVDVAEDGSLGNSRLTTSVLGLNVNNDPNHSGVEGENVLDAIKTLKTSIDASGGGGGDSTVLVKSPVGTIVIWSGTADNIPTGWQLCDGTNGTPDLRDKFVLGAGTKYAVGAIGGSEKVQLSLAQIPAHAHQNQGNRVSGSGTWTALNGFGKPEDETVEVIRNLLWSGPLNTESAGSNQSHPNMPPYYTLCYIMKLTADETDGVTMDDVNSAIDTKLDAYEPQEVYSTEETRIGTWIDGKPLYRKIVIGELTSKGSWQKIGDPIQNANVVSIMSSMIRSQYSDVLPSGPFYLNGVNYGYAVVYGMTGTTGVPEEGLYGFTSSEFYFGKVITILEYTKTTDPSSVKLKASDA